MMVESVWVCNSAHGDEMVTYWTGNTRSLMRKRLQFLQYFKVLSYGVIQTTPCSPDAPCLMWWIWSCQFAGVLFLIFCLLQLLYLLIVSRYSSAGVFMAISSNTRYQVVNGLERVVEGSAISRRVPLVALAFTVGIRFANNIYGGMQFVDWARMVGVQ